MQRGTVTVQGAGETGDGRLHPRLPSLVTLEYVKTFSTAVLVLVLLVAVAYFMVSDRRTAMRLLTRPGGPL